MRVQVFSWNPGLDNVVSVQPYGFPQRLPFTQSLHAATFPSADP